jgi:SNF2 family DNA or RNA helicase
MIEINWTRCKLPPFDHQKVGTRELVNDTNPARGRIYPRVLALFDEVGAAKTKQVIDAAHVLYGAGSVDTMVVVTPGFARGVWADPDPMLGEVAKHAWPGSNHTIAEFHAKTATLKFGQGLNWIVTNYEFLRSGERLKEFVKQVRGRRMWIVCDEAWAIVSHTSDNWKAVRGLRKLCERATILNGSPVDGSPSDLFAQMRFLDPRIISHNYFGVDEPMSWTHFKARYEINAPIKKRNGETLKTPNGRDIIQTVGFQNQEELTAKTAPYVLQRKTRDVIPLPPELEPVFIDAPLSDPTWKLYVQMRDDMVAWLDNGDHSIARQAIVKGLRLAQITSGFLGGVDTLELDPFDENDEDFEKPVAPIREAIRDISREKLDAVIAWLNDNGRPDRLLMWFRFRPELQRAAEALAADYTVYKLQGQQSKDERRAAIRVLAPGNFLDGPVAVLGNAQAGGAALNFSGTNLAIYMSYDFRLRVLNQSKGRIARPGQKKPFRYGYVRATGPNGQKTIDHKILKALFERQNIADWTTAQWRAILTDKSESLF